MLILLDRENHETAPNNTTEEVENYYECFKCGSCYLMLLRTSASIHQNVGFALFAKFHLKTGSYAYEFYFIPARLTTSEDLVSSSVFIIT